MAEIVYTIPQLIKSVGIKGYNARRYNLLQNLLQAVTEPRYQAALKELTEDITGHSNVEVYTNEDITYSENSHFDGLPIYHPLLLQRVGDIDEDFLLESCIIDYGMSKNIVTTPVQGRDGSVKEYISDGDWNISINGAIATKGLGYPKEDKAKLSEFVKAKSAIPIVHPVLNAEDIYEIVITDIKYPPSVFTNVQPYQITAISNEPYELTLL